MEHETEPLADGIPACARVMMAWCKSHARTASTLPSLPQQSQSCRYAVLHSPLSLGSHSPLSLRDHGHRQSSWFLPAWLVGGVAWTARPLQGLQARAWGAAGGPQGSPVILLRERWELTAAEAQSGRLSGSAVPRGWGLGPGGERVIQEGGCRVRSASALECCEQMAAGTRCEAPVRRQRR